VGLLGEIRRDLRFELVELKVFASRHHVGNELGAVALRALKRGQDEQSVQISLFLDATRAAEVVARAALYELLHETSQHAARAASGLQVRNRRRGKPTLSAADTA
jgi:hypothetical protein